MCFAHTLFAMNLQIDFLKGSRRNEKEDFVKEETKGVKKEEKYLAGTKLCDQNFVLEGTDYIVLEPLSLVALGLPLKIPRIHCHQREYLSETKSKKD